jgi:hypothetical protein
VKLTLTHAELDATYGLRAGMALSLRVPYDVKDQRVHYTTLTGAPFTPPYGDIHHRTETLRGLADGDLLLLWQPARDWSFGIGTTLPFGETVPDPVELGREGKKHEHIQFGSGVFAPEMEIAFAHGHVSAIVHATIPISENSEGFRAPKSIRWSAGPSFNVARVRATLTVAGQYQTIGRWNGETDEGTGFSNSGLRLQLAIPAPRGVTITPSVYRELYSHGFNDETFSQGTTLGLTITRMFGR